MKHKFKEWGKRYFLAEILTYIFTPLIALLAFFLTKNLVITAYAGVIGENLVYYGFVAAREVCLSRKHHKIINKKYNIVSFLKNFKELIIEFGPSETLDSLIIRPFFMYIFPLMTGNITLGIIIGKICADIIFYVHTIIAYELRKKHVKN